MALLSTLAHEVGGTLIGSDGEVTAVQGLQEATSDQITFLANPKYAKAVKETNAGALLTQQEITDAPCAQIVVQNPYLAMAKISTLLHPTPIPQPGIHATATIDPSAQIHPEAIIGPHCVIGANTHINAGTYLQAQVYIGHNVSIGKNCIIYPHVNIMNQCIVGNAVILQSGCVVGSDGFGFAPDSQGKRHKIPQIGNVVIQDHVEIGANSTIDRATFGSTTIGEGTKVDNQVQIAHNVSTGKDCVIVSQVGIAGSTTLGDRVIIAGQTGLAGHIHITSDTTIAAKSGVAQSISQAGIYSGVPAIPHTKWLRQITVIKNIDNLRQRLIRLEKKQTPQS